MREMPTKLVRKVARKFGCQTIYTNKYEHCRTVKMVGGSAFFNTKLIKKITKKLKKKGFENESDFTIKVNKTNTQWGSRESSIIVRFPFEAYA